MYQKNLEAGDSLLLHSFGGSNGVGVDWWALVKGLSMMRTELWGRAGIISELHWGCGLCNQGFSRDCGQAATVEATWASAELRWQLPSSRGSSARVSSARALSEQKPLVF